MAIPIFTCPDALEHCWQKPLERAGVVVESIDEIVTSAGKNLTDGRGVLSFLTRRRGCAAFTMRKRYDPHNDTFRLIVTITGSRSRDMENNDQSNRALLDLIERILYGAGGKVLAGFKPHACKRIYHCPPELLEGWSKYFALDNSLTPHENDDVRQGAEAPPDHLANVGIQGTRLELFGGDSIISDTQNFIPYFAINYNDKVVFGSSSRERALNEVETVLLHNGAKRINMTDNDSKHFRGNG